MKDMIDVFNLVQVPGVSDEKFLGQMEFSADQNFETISTRLNGESPENHLERFREYQTMDCYKEFIIQQRRSESENLYRIRLNRVDALIENIKQDIADKVFNSILTSGVDYRTHYNMILSLEQSEYISYITSKRPGDTTTDFNSRLTTFVNARKIIITKYDDNLKEELEQLKDEPLEEWLERVESIIEDNLSFLYDRRFNYGTGTDESNKEFKKRNKFYDELPAIIKAKITHKEESDKFNSPAATKRAEAEYEREVEIQEAIDEKIEVKNFQSLMILRSIRHIILFILIIIGATLLFKGLLNHDFSKIGLLIIIVSFIIGSIEL